MQNLLLGVFFEVHLRPPERRDFRGIVAISVTFSENKQIIMVVSFVILLMIVVGGQASI